MSRVNHGYVIDQKIRISNAVIVLGVNPNLVDKEHTTPYVTWETDKDMNDFYWGHYFNDRYAAERDLVKRGMDKVRYFDCVTGFHDQQKEDQEEQ